MLNFFMKFDVFIISLSKTIGHLNIIMSMHKALLCFFPFSIDPNMFCTFN
jgi:hypothetical protein